VFCHFREEIDIIRQRLVSKGVITGTFDGRTSKEEREILLQSQCDVLILQIQTGCEGLNLQQFKEVYFVSPTWNPAVEDQAVARSHRIGQTEPVDVFRFIMEGFDNSAITLDSHVRALQILKRKEADLLNKVCKKTKKTKKNTKRKFKILTPANASIEP
jgi:Superfamily II DNA/RNA helicases, SNF2 family